MRRPSRQLGDLIASDWGLILRIAIDDAGIDVIGTALRDGHGIALTQPAAEVDLAATRTTKRPAMRLFRIKHHFANRAFFQ